MNKLLKDIVAQKEKEVSILKQDPYMLHIYGRLSEGLCKSDSGKCFSKALRIGKHSVIAEIKRRSPSTPHISDIPEPEELAAEYIAGGASAVSVLTDTKFFGGSIEDLKRVRRKHGRDCCPLLRKDFIIDPIQIAQAIDAGADAVLLIARILGKEKCTTLISLCKHWGIDALLEVHSEDELDTALESGAEIIGINNRNLDTLEIDLNISRTLIRKMPYETIKVSESGIRSPEVAKELFGCGFNALLIGEFLSSSGGPQKLIKEIVS